MLSRRILVVCLMPFCLLGSLVHAQIKPLDATRQNQILQPGQTTQAPGTQQVITKRYTTTPAGAKQQFPYALRKEPMTGHIAEGWRNADQVSRFGFGNLYKTKTLSYNQYDTGRYQGDGRQARIDNMDTMREILMATKYNGKEFDTMRKFPNFQEMVNNLSMREINRFAFRKNHSTESGIPVQKAGSGESVPNTGLPAANALGTPHASTMFERASTPSTEKTPTQSATSAVTSAKQRVGVPQGFQPTFGEKKVTVSVE